MYDEGGKMMPVGLEKGGDDEMVHFFSYVDLETEKEYLRFPIRILATIIKMECGEPPPPRRPYIP